MRGGSRSDPLALQQSVTDIRALFFLISLRRWVERPTEGAMRQ